MDNNSNEMSAPKDVCVTLLINPKVSTVTHEVVYDGDGAGIIIYSVKFTLWYRIKAILNARQRNNLYLETLGQLRKMVPQDIQVILNMEL